jgi:acyl carrier protein phosphodiesterase
VNWLAHLYLTRQSPEGWLGALLGDVVRGPIPTALDAEIRNAIALHRQIDTLTTTHPAIRRSCARIDGRHGHYRRVIVDVFYDHVLARSWAEWSDQPLTTFLTHVYAGIDLLLLRRPDLTPAFYVPMRDQGWLESYSEVEAIETTLRRMRRRLRRDHPMQEAVRDLVAEGAGFADDFHAFLPDAIARARGLDTGT